MNEQDKRLIDFDKDGKDYFISEQEEITRLKQENDQLKKENKVNLSRSLDLNKELQQLTNENAELKAKNERLKKENEIITGMHNSSSNRFNKLYNILQEIRNNCAEILATIEEEGKPNRSIVDTIWCKNIPCCTLWELVEGMQNKINEVLNER